MAVRFRKSVSLGKGARLNFSKSGLSSISFGKRNSGLSLSLGKNGTFLNTGIPGTGLSARSKIGGSLSQGSKQKIPAAVKEWAIYTNDPQPSASITVNENGDIVFFGKDGQQITDKNLISIIKRTPQYKEQKEYLRITQMKKVASIVKEKEEANNSFIDIHLFSDRVFPPKSYEDRLGNLELRTYTKQAFSEPEPSPEELQVELSREADATVKGLFNLEKKKRAYFNERFQNRLDTRRKEWSEKKAIHDALQNEIKKEKDAQYLEEYTAEKNALCAMLKGDAQFIEEEACAWISSIELPVDIETFFEYRQNLSTLMVDLDLPEIEDLPSEIAVQLKSGALKTKSKSQKQLREEYSKCIFGLALFLASNLFNISPCISRIVISGFSQRVGKKGEINDDYLYSIIFLRDGFYGVDYQQIDPEEFCMRFENRCSKSVTNIFKAIEPYN